MIWVGGEWGPPTRPSTGPGGWRPSQKIGPPKSISQIILGASRRNLHPASGPLPPLLSHQGAYESSPRTQRKARKSAFVSLLRCIWPCKTWAQACFGRTHTRNVAMSGHGLDCGMAAFCDTTPKFEEKNHACVQSDKHQRVVEGSAK